MSEKQYNYIRHLKSCAAIASVFLTTYANGLQNDAITSKNLKMHVEFLSSDALEGRLTGTQGEKSATLYVATLFQNLGLEPAGDNQTFFQSFDFNSGVSLRKQNSPFIKNSTHQQKKNHGRNVLAKLTVGAANGPMIIIGAHIDHLGHGETGGSRSQAQEIHFIHHGADDNASGVASVLEAAIKLSKLKAEGKLHGNKNILFAIWSGEEIGLLGSSHFIQQFMQNKHEQSLRPYMSAYINLDMVGRLRKKLIIQGVDSSASWPALITQTQAKHKIDLILQKDSYLPTDSTSFYLHRIPALNFFTGSHDEYHTPRDTVNTLNFAGMKNITNFLVDLILALESTSNSLDFQQIKNPHVHTVRGFRIYLGTIPDYTSTDLIGVKLAGVTKGSPSERAGLKQNDVIVELAGKKIRDIYDYSFVLNALHAHEPVALVALRGQKRVTLTIVPQPRV